MNPNNCYQNNSPRQSSKSALRQPALPEVQRSGQGYPDSNDWQVVDFPDIICVDTIPGVVSNSINEPMNNSPVATHTSLPLSPEREAELLSLIRDLNECNDVLLSKVSQLEDSLDRSQTALQAEIDRSHQTSVTSDLVAARPTDRQIARLVTELELSNQSLKRYELLNESLQAELAAVQERANQLEHEHTLMQQNYTDQCQRSVKAENACQDLRARLQRQQRYTLQFKAALEKCLNVSAGSPATAVGAVSVQAVHQAAATVAMPKAQNIQPWASEPSYNKLDPQLESMIRSAKAPASPVPEQLTQALAPRVTSTPTTAIPTNPDPEAEAQLWHDLARVVEAPAETGASTLSRSSQDIASLEVESQGSERPPASLPTPGDTHHRESVLTALAAVAEFTEPSPWGQPLTPAPQVSAPTPERREINLELLSPQGAVPSPVIYPLKPQKRIQSLAAVELPAFPRLKQPAQE